MPYIVSGNVKLFFEENGYGYPIIFLHEFESDSRARGMKAMGPKMAHHPARIQPKYKDPRGWREYLSRLKRHSSIGMSNSLARFQRLRPSLFEFSDELSHMAMPAIQ